MFTLGINAAYHDCSATLVRDGVVVAAAEEERFTRVKHGKRPVPFTTWQLPFHAIDYCLAEAGIDLAGVDHVAYAYDPGLLLGPAGTSASSQAKAIRHSTPGASHHGDRSSFSQAQKAKQPPISASAAARTSSGWRQSS